jgi:hypothetical protein
MASYLLSLAFVATVAATAADPTIDGDPDGKQGWYSTNFRGTLDIIWPCLLTVFLCCWNAVHPDIQHPDSKWWQRYADRSIGLILGAVAPEIFVYLAFQERFWARKNARDMVAKVGQENWSITHAFYANMGGFAVDVEPEDLEVASSCRLGYLSETSIAQQFELGHIRQGTWITAKEICDKGKADSLVKGLTIVQILWLFIQSVARLIQHLPLTTLELGTLAYVPCSLLIYYLWWDKPYEINVPTSLRLDPQVLSEDCGSISSLSAERISINISQERRCEVPFHAETNSIDTVQKHETTGSSVAESSSMEFNKVDIYHYKIYTLLQKSLEANEGHFETKTHLFTMTAVFLVVGAIHISAWNFGFATPLEQTLWRVCSLIITFSIPLCWLNLSVIWTVTDQWSGRWWHRHEDPDGSLTWRGRWTHKWIRMATYLLIMVYTLARIFLVVEVFLSLRATPKAAYKTPEWSNIVPHVG